MEFNFEKDIKCTCGVIIKKVDFRKHYKECDKFKKNFGKLDDRLSNIIKSYSNPVQQLIMLKILFEEYIKKLNKQIKGNFVPISASFKESFLKSLEQKQINEESIKNNKKENDLKNPFEDLNKSIEKSNNYDKKFIDEE